MVPVSRCTLALATCLFAGCVHALAVPTSWGTAADEAAAGVERDVEGVRRGTWLPDAAFDVAEGSGLRWRFVPATSPAAPSPSSRDSGSEVGGTLPEASEVWPPAPVDKSVESNRRIEAPASSPRDDEPGEAALREMLDADGLAAWNAAVLLARRLDREAGPRIEPILQRLVLGRPEYDAESGAAIRPDDWRHALRLERPVPEERRVHVGANLQAAAAEAWAFWLGSTAADPVDALAPIGRALERTDLPHHVRAALYRGAARWVPPVRLPYVEEAIGETARERTPVEVRRAAVEACCIHAVALRERELDTTGGSLWPRRLDEARWDPDPGIRVAYGRWTAISGDERAIEVLRDQLGDESVSVRSAAVDSLGLLETDAARDELASLAARSESDLRAAAVRALGRWGPSGVEPFAEDDSHAVRLAVARALGEAASARSAGTLLGLVVDRNPRVEEGAVAAVAAWPDDLAVPVLLRALEEGDWPTRAAAGEQLARRLGREIPYERSAPLEERRRAVTAIAERFGLSRHVTIEAAAAAVDDAAVPDARRAELASYLDDLATATEERARRLLLDRLLGTRAAEVPALERLLAGRSADVVALVRREVLPRVSEAHEALRLLDAADLAERREGARRLERLAEPASLSPFVLAALHEALHDETNAVVWRSVLRGVFADADPAAARVVRLALGHDSPELRLLACEYVAAHGRPDHAAWVLPLLRDERPEVVRAAVRAAGRCRNPVAIEGVSAGGEEPFGLRDLLVHAHVGVRREAAVALAVLGDARGIAEIDRLSRSPDVEVRSEAVAAMSDSHRPEFVGSLVRIVGGEPSDRVRRAAFAALDHLVPADRREGMPDWTRAPDAAAAAWQRWPR